MAQRPSKNVGKQVSRRFSRKFQFDMIWEGGLVGLVGGGVVTLYRLCLTHAEEFLRWLLVQAHHTPLALAGFLALLLLSCLVVAKLVGWEPYTQGSGIPQTDAEVMGRIDMPWHRVMFAKFTEGSLLTLSGLSLGREGPSIQLGGMGGKAVSRALRRGRGEERLLVTCGAAAGMSAAFHAPLTGTLFAIEEIHKEFTPSLIVSAMASAVASDFLVSQVLGVSPVLQLSVVRDLPHQSYLYVLALGVLCGIVGSIHNKGMFFCSERVYGRLAKLPFAVRLAIPFVITAVIAFAAPVLLCGGDAIVKELARPSSLPTLTLLALLLGKYLFTTVCFASGAPGGTLFPLCVMGMLTGALYGSVLSNVTGMQDMFIINFMALGIAGIFSSVVRAPVTGVVLAFELTGSMSALLSVSIVSIVSYVVANVIGVDAFYEHLLVKLLGVTKIKSSVRGGVTGEKVLHVYTVGAGSQVEGKRISEVSWPESSRIITIDREGVDVLPTGSTKLQALDEILVIMGADGEDEDQAKIWALCKNSLATTRTPRS